MSVMPSLTGGQAIGGVAIFGVIAGFWNKIRLYISKVTSLFIIRIDVKGQLATAVEMLLVKEFKCSPLGKKIYRGDNEYVRPLCRNQLVAFEKIPTESTIWWRGKKPLVLGRDEERGSITITFVRWVYNRNKFLQEAVDKFNERKELKNWKKGDRFFIRKKYGSIGAMGSGQLNGSDEVTKETADVGEDKYTSNPLKWKREELGQPKKDSAINDLSLRENILDFVKESLLWRESEKWFKERSIPWKKSALCDGGPGTGKTAFVRALGQELNMPIFCFDLATMTNTDFSETWNDAMDYTPCIFLFEDIDAIFEGRKNVAVKGLQNGLTFDCFLNSLDGVENTNGIFVIITTNNISTIDPAIGNISNSTEIATRPGRIDRILEFKILDAEGREKMANRILDGFSKKIWRHLLEEGKKDTGAQFQERCCRLALKLFWDDKTKKIEQEKTKKTKKTKKVKQRKNVESKTI